MFDPGVNVFETVGFLSDELDLLNSNMSPLKQADSLPISGVCVGIRTLRLRMKFILFQHFAVRTYASRRSTSIVLTRRDRHDLGTSDRDDLGNSDRFRRNPHSGFHIRTEG